MFDRSAALELESGYHQNRDLILSSNRSRNITDDDLVGNDGIAGSQHLLRCDAAQGIPTIATDGRGGEPKRHWESLDR